jgi:hypothetical protein
MSNDKAAAALKQGGTAKTAFAPHAGPDLDKEAGD